MNEGVMNETAPLRLDNVHRTFVQGPVELRVLRGASLTVEAGEIVALAVGRRQVDASAHRRAVGASR